MSGVNPQGCTVLSFKAPFILYLGDGIWRRFRSSRGSRSRADSIEYVSGFFGPAVADLPAPPSFRDE